MLPYCQLDPEYQWNLKPNFKVFVEKDEAENVVSEMSASLSRLIEMIFLLDTRLLFTERADVLSQDLVKSQGREIRF